MELKHLIIAAIVANAAKSGLDSGLTVKNRPWPTQFTRTRGRPTGLSLRNGRVCSCNERRWHEAWSMPQSRVFTRLASKYSRPVHKVQSATNNPERTLRKQRLN